jgi:hypothetical protein
MQGTLEVWPDWPVFTEDNAEAGDNLVKVKSAIIDRNGKEALIRSWLKVCKALEAVTDRISVKGSAVIPEIGYKDIFALSDKKKQDIKDVGCFVVKNVVSKEQADEWFLSLKEYTSANKQNINGKPLQAMTTIQGLQPIEV